MPPVFARPLNRTLRRLDPEAIAGIERDMPVSDGAGPPAGRRDAAE
jgi:hypothetical protein